MIVVYDKETKEITGWGRWDDEEDKPIAANEDWIRIPD